MSNAALLEITCRGSIIFRNQVEDNVGYETFGHGYFLEDGGEKHTVFDGNLGANTRSGGFLTTDFTYEY